MVRNIYKGTARKRRTPVFDWERGAGPQEIERRSLVILSGRRRIYQATRHERRFPRLGAALILGLVMAATYFAYHRYFRETDYFLYHRVLQSPPLSAMVEMKSLLPALPSTQTGHVSYRVRSGDTWASITGGLKLSLSIAQGINSAMEELEKSAKQRVALSVGDVIDFAFDASSGLDGVTIERRSGERIELARLAEATFRAVVQPKVHVPRDHVLVGSITRENSSFASAAQSAGVSYDVVDSLVDLLSDRIRFRQDFRVDDRFTVIFSESSPNSSAEILAARLDVAGSKFFAIRFVGNDGKARYFDGEGKLLGNTFLRYPLKFSRISSEFTTARFHPILKRSRPHNGVDFAAPTGTPVRSVAHGKVIFAGRKGGNGIMISIKHDDRYQTVYCHLSRTESGIRKGSLVTRGQVIGAVGSTGLATGPHLHFGFFENGKYVDPLRIKLPTVDTLDRKQHISDSYLKRVLFTLEHYQKLELDRIYMSG